MRKITVKFNKLKDIENIKKVMRTVYAGNSDHLPDIAKFHLGGKIFIPSQVDKAELHIITANGTEIITFSNAALSFYLGSQHPFTKVAMTSEDEGNYIVLPWNLGSQAGRDNLKNLINRIPSNIRELKYIIYVNSQDNLSSLSLENSKDLSQSLTSLASLHLSDIAAEDETEGLLNKIDNLEQSLRERDNVVNQKQNENTNLLRQLDQKQAQINSLTTQVNSMSSQVYSMSSQVNNMTSQVSSKDSQINSKNSQIANLTTQVNNLQASNNSYSSQINQFNSNRNGYYLENDQGFNKTYRLTNYTGSLIARSEIDFGSCGIVLTGGGGVVRTIMNITFNPS